MVVSLTGEYTTPAKILFCDDATHDELSAYYVGSLFVEHESID